MATDLKISATSLDFDGIKDSLKQFLAGQDRFRDYNFEGAGLSVLLDVLAANSQFNALFANFITNEMFLDSATQRSNIISIAKMLNYVPSSIRAPVATIRMKISNVFGNPSTITLDDTIRLTTLIDGKTYTFSPVETHTVNIDSNNEYVQELDVYQGQFVSEKFSNFSINRRLEILNSNIDTRFLSVSVFEGGSEAGIETPYSLASTVSEVDRDDTVYYLQENVNGNYEVFFGDNVLGKSPESGSLVVLKYFITNGEEANSANLFAKSGAIAGSNTVAITTLSPATGGAAAESLESIKRLAPKFKTTENRAVSVSDYKAIVLKEYPDIQSISVWGGEDNIPVSYGKVFMALRPRNDTILSTAYKQTIADNLQDNYMVVATRPEIVDPDYLKVIVGSKIFYNSTSTIKTSGEIESIVATAIEKYFDTNVQDFDSPLYFSQLSRAIDTADASIVGNQTYLKLRKSFNPTLGLARHYDFDFSNPLAPNSFSSTRFNLFGDADTFYGIKDVPTKEASGEAKNGALWIFRTVANTDVLTTEIGTIDYSTGKVTLNNFQPTLLVAGFEMDLTAGVSTSTLPTDITEVDYNIVTNRRNQIIILEQDAALITVQSTNAQ